MCKVSPFIWDGQKNNVAEHATCSVFSDTVYPLILWNGRKRSHD